MGEQVAGSAGAHPGRMAARPFVRSWEPDRASPAHLVKCQFLATPRKVVRLQQRLLVGQELEAAERDVQLCRGPPARTGGGCSYGNTGLLHPNSPLLRLCAGQRPHAPSRTELPPCDGDANHLCCRAKLGSPEGCRQQTRVEQRLQPVCHEKGFAVLAQVGGRLAPPLVLLLVHHAAAQALTAALLHMAPS